MKRSSISVGKIIAITFSVWMLVGACIEFYNIAWGTGKAVGLFSPKWLLLFSFFVLFCMFLYTCIGAYFLEKERFFTLVQGGINLRNKLSALRWLFVILFLLFPVWFLQRTMWGIVFDGIYFRLALWALTLFVLSVFITRGSNLIDWKSF